MRLIYKIILTIMVMIETSNIFKSGLDIYKNVFIGNRPLFLICTSFIAQLSNKEYNDNNSGSDVEYSKNYNYSVHKKKRNIKDINFVFPYSEQINIYTQKLMIFAINNKECLKTADKDLPIKFDEYKNINIIGIYKRIRVELRSKEKVSLYINNMSEIRPKSDLYPIVVDELSSEDNGLGENSTIYRDLSETRFRPNYKLPINILNEFDNYMNSGGNKIIFFIYDGIWYIYEGNNYYSPLRIGSNMEHLGIFLYTNITQSIHYILVKEITREKSIIDNLGYDRKRKLNKNNYDNEYNILNNLLFEFISRRSLLNYLEKEQDELNDMYSRQIVILREKIESDLRHENISRLKQNNIPVNCNDCTDVFKCPNCNIEIFPTQSDIEFNSVYYLQQKGFWLEDTIINPNYDLFNTTFIDRTDKNINMNENKNRIHKNSTISESDMSNISDYVENNKGNINIDNNRNKYLNSSSTYIFSDKEKMKTVNDKPINKIDSLSYENSASLGSRFENGNDLELDLNLGLKERLDGMLQEESIPESKKSYKSVLSRERSTKIRPYREEYIDMKLSGEIESSIEGSMKIKPSKKGPGKVNPSREEFREAESSRDGSKKVKPSRERYRETESSRDESRKVKSSRGRYRETESSRDESRKVKSSRERYRETESSRDESRKVKSSRERYRETESSRDESRKVKSSRERYRETESSRDESRKVKSSRERSKETESSRDESRKVKSSRERSKETESSRDESKKVKPFRERYREAESSRDGSKKVKSSRERYRETESSRGRYREIESSRDGSKKVKPSRERYRETESSRDESRKVKSSRERYRETESSRDESIKVEPSRGRYREIESSRDESVKAEPSRERYREIESSRNESMKVKLSRNKSRKVKSSRGRYRETESSRDESIKVEPSRERYREAESPRRRYRETESSIDESMKVEPSRDEYTKVEPSRDEYTKVEPSRDEYTKVEPSRDEYTKVEPSRDEYTKVEPSRDEYTKVEPSRDESRKVKPFKKRYKEGYRAMELSGERYKSRLKSMQNRKKSELESKLIPTIKRPELEISEGRLESISKSALNIKHQQYESYINNIAINNTCYYQEDKNIDKEIINSIIKLKEPQIFTMGMQNIENKVLFWKNGDNKKLTREVNDEIVDLFIGKSSLTKSIGIISDNENSEN